MFKSVPLHQNFECRAPIRHWLVQRFQNTIEEERFESLVLKKNQRHLLYEVLELI